MELELEVSIGGLGLFAASLAIIESFFASTQKRITVGAY